MKFKVPVTITLNMEVHAADETHAAEVAKESFDIEMHLDELESSTKFGKPKQIESEEDEEETLGAPYDSDEDEDDDDY